MLTARNKRVQRSRQKVLLAIYWLADEDGLYCHATNAELAKAAGVGVETVRGYLHGMEHDGTVVTFGSRRSGTYRRLMILMDHPAAEAHVESALQGGRQLGLHTGIARGVYAGGGTFDDDGNEE